MSRSGCPGMADDQGIRNPCGAPKLPGLSYCRGHWNMYYQRRMVAKRKPTAVPPPRPRVPRERGANAIERRRGHCASCGIRFCDDFPRADDSKYCVECAGKQPLIRYAHALGEERFYQMHRQTIDLPPMYPHKQRRCACGTLISNKGARACKLCANRRRGERMRALTAT